MRTPLSPSYSILTLLTPSLCTFLLHICILSLDSPPLSPPTPPLSLPLSLPSHNALTRYLALSLLHSTVLPATKDDPRQRKPDITTAKIHLGWEPKVHINK